MIERNERAMHQQQISHDVLNIPDLQSLNEKGKTEPIIVSVTKQNRYQLTEVRNKIKTILLDLEILPELTCKRVLIKPNCTSTFLPKEGRTTHPTVLKALALVLKEQGAQVLIGESSSSGVDTQLAFEKTGIKKVAQELNLKLLDFKKSNYISLTTKPSDLNEVQFPEEILDVDWIISLPKLKTNYITKISCSLKNLMGLLKDKAKLDAHRKGLAESIVNNYYVLNNHVNTLAIVDGILGSELYSPKRAGLLIGSLDLIACDSICAQIMGVNPEEVKYLNLAYNSDFRIMLDIKVTGIQLEQCAQTFKSEIPSLNFITKEFGVEIVNGNPCKSCIGSLYHILNKIKIQKPQLLTNLKIAIGECRKNSRDTVLFGNCADDSKSNLIVVGCPPVSSDFLRVIERINNVNT